MTSPPYTQEMPSSQDNFFNSGQVTDDESTTPSSSIEGTVTLDITSPLPIKSNSGSGSGSGTVFVAPADEEVLETGTRNAHSNGSSVSGKPVQSAAQSVSGGANTGNTQQHTINDYDPVPLDPMHLEIDNLHAALRKAIADLQQGDRTISENIKKAIATNDAKAEKRARDTTAAVERQLAPINKRLTKLEDRQEKLSKDYVTTKEMAKIKERIAKCTKKRSSK